MSEETARRARIDGINLSRDVAEILKEQLSLMRLMPLATGDNPNGVLNANANIFGSYVAPINPPCKVRVMATFDTGGGNLKLMRAKNRMGSQAVPEGFNGVSSPTTLSANFGYVFDSFANEGDWLNFQYTVAAKPLTFRVYEMDLVLG